MRALKNFLVAVILFSMPVVVLAIQDEGNISVDTVLAEIMTQQSISEIKNVDCDKVTDDQWEELGEAVMSIMHPDQKQHELMDQMMGGEGSDSLKAMHIYMGQKYLDCSSDFGMMGGTSGMMGGMMGGNMMGMMGGGMMSNLLTNSSVKNTDGNWSYSMMGFPTTAGFGWGWMIFGWLFMVLFWALVILAIVWLAKTLIGKTSWPDKNLTAAEILKRRYAKGEISKKEFEEMKKEIS